MPDSPFGALRRLLAPECRAGRPGVCANAASRPGRTTWRGAPIHGLLSVGCLSDLVLVPEDAAIPVYTPLSHDHVALLGCAVATGVGAVTRCARLEPGATVAVGERAGSGSTSWPPPGWSGPRTSWRWTGARLVLSSPGSRGAHILVSPEEARSAIDEMGEVDVPFEATGDLQALEQALETLSVGGELVLLGGIDPAAELVLRPRTLVRRQLRSRAASSAGSTRRQTWRNWPGGAPRARSPLTTWSNAWSTSKA